MCSDSFNKKFIFLFFCIILFIFNIFALSRAASVNLKLRKEFKLYGSIERYYHSYNTINRFFKVYNLAKQRAERPFFEVKDHFLYRDKNPGLFVFFAEIFIRMGAKTPFPIQVFAIILFNIGIIVGYLWQKEYFKNQYIPIFSTFFLIITPYIFYHSSSIHQYPYSFCFFNLTILFFVKYLQQNKKKWIILTCLFYLILCQCYFMFYVSTFIILIGMFYLEKKKWISIETIVILFIPIISVIILIFEIAMVNESIHSGFFKLVDYFLARTVDIRIPNSTFPDEKVLGVKNFFLYPVKLSWNVQSYFSLPISNYLLMLCTCLILAHKDKRLSEYRIFLFIVPAGLSWHLFMFEHTIVHNFSVIFGYFLWMLIFSFFIKESYSYIRNNFKTSIGPKILIVFILLLFLKYLEYFFIHYVINMFIYLRNIIFV